MYPAGLRTELWAVIFHESKPTARMTVKDINTSRVGANNLSTYQKKRQKLPVCEIVVVPRITSCAKSAAFLHAYLCNQIAEDNLDGRKAVTF